MSRKVGHLVQYLEFQRASLDDIVPKVLCTPSRSAVHKLRIVTRRSRAVLWVLRHSSPSLCFDGLDNHLRNLGRMLGSVRELDMAIKDAKKFKLDPSDLKSARKVKLKLLHRYLKGKRPQKLSLEMARALKGVRSQNEIDTDVALEVLAARMSRWQKRRLHGSARIHRFRVAVKKWRYILEALGKPVEKLKDIQDLLGKSHDLETLQTFLGKKRAIKREQSRLAVEAIQLAKPILAAVDRKIDIFQQ